jgi:polysaccharide export outer membrane protein
MPNESIGGLGKKHYSRGQGPLVAVANWPGAAVALILLMGVAGCQSPVASRPIPPLCQFPELKEPAGAAAQGQALTPEQLELARRLLREANTNGLNPPRQSAQQNPAQPEALLLREGDVVKVSFPGAPDLNTVATLRRDGIVTLPLVGEFKAAGLAPSEMEKELVKRYAPHLQVKELSVAVVSSAFAVYVTGVVLRPGKVASERPLSALEAVMEAGGVDYTRANLKKVSVTRRENGRLEHYTLNLKKELQGQPTESFKLKPFDILYVPERFVWF